MNVDIRVFPVRNPGIFAVVGENTNNGEMKGCFPDKSGFYLFGFYGLQSFDSYGVPIRKGAFLLCFSPSAVVGVFTNNLRGYPQTFVAS